MMIFAIASFAGLLLLGFSLAAIAGRYAAAEEERDRLEQEWEEAQAVNRVRRAELRSLPNRTDVWVASLMKPPEKPDDLDDLYIQHGGG